MSEGKPDKSVVLVSGLSGAGRASILHALEDIGYEAVDNPPLPLLDELVNRPAAGGERLALGVDTRSHGFDVEKVVAAVNRLRHTPAMRLDLVFAWADETVLLRRYTETRRRHPLAPEGRVIDGIVAERKLMAPLQEAADLVIDTSDLPLPELRRLIEQRFGAGRGELSAGLSLSLLSFAFPAGLPREADMVFDVRFLRNPHYVSSLRAGTGLDAEVAEYVATDPDFPVFFERLTALLGVVLPRFVQEGKKYATLAVGCTGGRHRSVAVVEKLASYLKRAGWRVSVNHREIAREMESARAGEGKGRSTAADRDAPPDAAAPQPTIPADQAQEA
jgi:UPF0042 nucleotide-binding protein